MMAEMKPVSITCEHSPTYSQALQPCLTDVFEGLAIVPDCNMTKRLLNLQGSFLTRGVCPRDQDSPGKDWAEVGGLESD